MIYAVIDTNVLVSALLSHGRESPPMRVLESVMVGKVTPVFNDDILAEYLEVLSRRKFGFSPQAIHELMQILREQGINTDPAVFAEELPDEDDRVFYEVTLAAQADDAHLVTGNLKHYPRVPFVVSPAEFMAFVDEQYAEED